ncbi:hypothetical protein O3P69_001985 [Scylla paramamosain]|uniref:Uncharacterized protein n=1 Tax=Scylla paramamosain TaxID=85552 RepID=A0AAW0V7V2_SCYPA
MKNKWQTLEENKSRFQVSQTYSRGRGAAMNRRRDLGKKSYDWDDIYYEDYLYNDFATHLVTTRGFAFRKE